MSNLRLIRSSLLGVFLPFAVGAASLHGQQGMLSERWNSEIPMMNMDIFRKEINQRAPDVVGMTTSGLSFVEVAGHYGTRLRGRLVAPETSDYTFFISGDDQCELWLSPDGSPFNRELVCWSQEFTSTLWNKLPSQRSKSIRLQQGQSYYIEGLMTNWGGSDYLAVGWKRAPLAVFNESAWAGGSGTWAAADDGIQFSASSGDLAGVADDGLFRQREWSGKGEFIVKVSEMNNPDPAAKAGLMMRAHRGDASPYGMIFKRPDSSTAFQYRLLDGDITVAIDTAASGEWLRLVKSANDLTASVSADRITWVTVGSVTFASLPVTYLVGTAVSSNTGPAGVPVTGKFTPLEALNLLPVETIPGSVLVPYNGDPADLDDDSLPDAWETANGLDPANGFGDEGAYSDPDGDSLTNQVEYRYGLTPKVANEIANTLLVERWNYPSGHSVEEFTTQTKFHDKPDSIVLAAPIDLKFPGVFFGSRIRGSITPAVSGNYTFWISARSSAEIWLSLDDALGKYAKQRIASLSPMNGTSHGIGSGESNLWDRFASQQSKVIHLEAGKSYHLEVLHESSFGLDAHASVAWARDGGAREILPASVVRSYARSADDRDDDCLPDAWEAQNGLNPADNGFHDLSREGERGDFDGDGLNNREEFLLGTAANNWDSDGDGLSDFSETRTYRTNPLVSDSPSEEVVNSVPARSVADSSHGWTLVDGAVFSNQFRGSLEWDFQVSQNGFWIVQLATRLRGNLFASEELDVKVWIDGRSLGRYTLRFGSDHRALLRVVTPKIPRGSHRFKLVIDNMVARRQLGIESLEVRKPTGMDLDGDGLPDWVETMMAGSDQLMSHPVSSRISPYCLEGHSRLAGEVKVNGEPVSPGAGDTHWYYNLPLAGSRPAEYRVKFSSGIKSLGAISWEPTNVLDGGEMVVRVGDSLKLGAWTGNSSEPIAESDDPEPQTEFSWITIEGVSRRVTETRAIKHTFTTPGIVDVTATKRDGDDPITLRVRVLHATLPDDTLALQNNLRFFNITTAQAAPELFFQPGRDLRLGNRETVSANEFRFQLYPEKGGSLGVSARLWENGPIADVASILSTTLTDAIQNGVATSEVAEEFAGHIIVRTPMVITDLPPGGTVKITIFRAGVTFLDGSTVKTLSVADLANGIFYLEFLFPEGMAGGYCHYIDVYDANNNLLGRR